MAEKVKAMVFYGPRDLQVREFDRPTIGDNDGLLRIEASGICGSDHEFYNGVVRLVPPNVLGHEPFGTIVEIGKVASERWGVQEGDRVAVEPGLFCGHCEDCRGPFPWRCRLYRPSSNYGAVSAEFPPYLWGSMAEYMYLAPETVVHKVSRDMPTKIAATFNALGAGFEWAYRLAGTKIGDVVAILGPGQRGLSSVIAAKEAGAGLIFVTGLGSDDYKLEVAKALGADVTINVEAEDPVRRVRELTGGRGAAKVVDCTANAPEAFHQARRMCMAGGTIVIAGLRGPAHPLKELNVDDIPMRGLTIKGAFGVSSESFKMAVKTIESGKYPLEKMATHVFPIQEAARAIQTLAGEIPGEKPICVCLMPETKG